MNKYFLFFSLIFFCTTLSANDLTAVVADATPPDFNNGSIDLTIDGGYAPYIIEWSNGETTEDIDGLSPGAYCVTVTDALCCNATLCLIVGVDCTELTADLQSTCEGQSIGSIDLNL